ncbi:F-box/WD-repeat protein [Tieghemostelium lacteum]|uniref:F-box/WD-repeat protein n=1 Tax=Tieghemostelium lacteum TaxID=361077 RepID=A0A151ZHX5_TIELA|nr:F-box/WD-repeat protein [Tieghemostelium lacteum]|eukprot:KYQ93601.1 F-box/WD-repeat protein [Tieghemostelium lacteum]
MEGFNWSYLGDPLVENIKIKQDEKEHDLVLLEARLHEMNLEIQSISLKRQMLIEDITKANNEKLSLQQTMNNCRQSVSEKWISIADRYGFNPRESFSLFSILPLEVMINIFEYLSFTDINLCICRVSKQWYRYSLADSIWKNLFQIKWNTLDIHHQNESKPLKAIPSSFWSSPILPPSQPPNYSPTLPNNQNNNNINNNNNNRRIIPLPSNTGGSLPNTIPIPQQQITNNNNNNVYPSSSILPTNTPIHLINYNNKRTSSFMSDDEDDDYKYRYGGGFGGNSNGINSSGGFSDSKDTDTEDEDNKSLNHSHLGNGIDTDTDDDSKSISSLSSIQANPDRPSFKKRLRIDWRELFIKRQRIENNWLRGVQKATKLPGHTDWITCLQFDGRILVTGSWDSSLKVWNIDTGDCMILSGLETDSGHSSGITCVQFKGNKLISGSSDSTLRIWDLSTGECIHVLQGHTDGVSCLCIIDDFTLASGSLDNTINLWSIESGKLLHSFSNHISGISCLYYKNNLLISGTMGGTLNVIDIPSRICLQTFHGHGDRVTSIQWWECPDDGGVRIISSSWDYTLRVWNLQTGKAVHVLTGHSFRVRCTQVRGNILVSGSWDTTVRVWDLLTGKCIHTLFGHSFNVWSLQFEGNRLVTAGWDKKVKVWDIDAGKLLYTLEGHTESIICIQFKGSKLVTAAKEIIVYDFDSDIPSHSHITNNNNINNNNNIKRLSSTYIPIENNTLVHQPNSQNINNNNQNNNNNNDYYYKIRNNSNNKF